VSIQQIKIDSLNDLFRCIGLSSLLEISGWPKPGNVHRTINFLDTRYEHFIAGAVAIQPVFYDFCKRIWENVPKNNKSFEFVNLGQLFYEATEAMMNWQCGGNVILGHILILAPLVASATICLAMNRKLYDDFQYYLRKIIDDANVKDTILLYKAIKSCNPGGLGHRVKYDITNEGSINELQKDNVTLKKIFEISKNDDLISQEYFSGFSITLEKGLPYFNATFEKFRDINIATVNTYLKLLSEFEDTLIIRKSGKDAAIRVKNLAKKVIGMNGIATKRGLRLVREFDMELQKEKGKLNPGTTADILTGVIFCALLFGLKF